MMWRKFGKRYGKILAAAVFLTVAGLCYGFAKTDGGGTVLGDFGITAEQTAGTGELWLDVESDSAAAVDSVTDGGTGNDAGAETEVSTVFVHICGEVEKPGVYELPEGSRIFEAIACAGGFTEQAEESALNLASTVSDGMQIVVLDKEEAKELAKAEQEVRSGLVNINTASVEELTTLKGIGESRAEDIIRYREESGGFQKIEDIMKVPGIKESGFQKIKDSITV